MVETYLIEETKDLIHDEVKQDEWKKQVKELKLKGQEKLINKEKKSPVPFMWMNRRLRRTFTALCSTEVEVSKYDKTPIPLEILGFIKLSEMENYFPAGIFIRYDDEKTDPVCIGKIKKKKDGYDETECYLIGRWGDEKRDFAELEKLAVEALIKKRTESLNTIKGKVEKAFLSIESDIKKYFTDEYLSNSIAEPSLYIS